MGLKNLKQLDHNGHSRNGALPVGYDRPSGPAPTRKARSPRGAGTAEPVTEVQIPAPKFEVVAIRIRGDAPLVLNAFPAKAKQAIRDKQVAGSQAKKGTKREAKDFQAMYEEARHLSLEGWDGIPAAAFRAAMISACRLVGFKMTLAKLSVFVIPDGLDRDGSTPLVKITKGVPAYFETYGRNATGVVDLRARPLFSPGWESVVRVRYDAAQFSATDVANLMARVGMQIGVGEGRPDSRNSAGQGWGTFQLVNDDAAPSQS